MPCGSGKKYKNCCYGKYDNVNPLEETPEKKAEADTKTLINKEVVEEINTPINTNNLLISFNEHAKRLKKIREENKENPNYPHVY